MKHTLLALAISPLAIHTQVNQYRLEQGLQPLAHDKELCQIAEARADQIQKDWSHKGFWQEIKKVKYKRIGENLAKDYTSEKALVQAWIASKPHKQNLDRPYTHQCIACKNNHCVQILRKK